MMIEICNLIIFITEIFTCVFYFENKFKRRCAAHTMLIFAGIISFLLYLIENIKVPLLNAASFILLLFIFLRVCYHAAIKSCMFSLLLLTAFMVAAEMIVMYLSSLIFGIDIDLCLENDVIFAVQAILAKLLFFVCIYLLSKRSVPEPKAGTVRALALLGILPVTSVLLMHTTIYICIYYDLGHRFKALLVLCSILLLLSNLMVFYIHEFTLKTTEQYTRLLVSRQREENRMEYYRLLEQQNNHTKILLHDITKHLNSIRLLSSGSNEDIHAYIASIADEFSMARPFDYCSNALLNLILYRYSDICRSEHIRFCVDAAHARTDFMSDPDITALFDNLLENAVEAARQSAEKSIDLSIDIRNTNFLVIRVRNSCCCKPVTADGRLMTSKKDPFLHGIGVKSIQRVVRKYDGHLDMHYQDTEEAFTVTAAFPITHAFSPPDKHPPE